MADLIRMVVKRLSKQETSAFQKIYNSKFSWQFFYSSSLALPGKEVRQKGAAKGSEVSEPVEESMHLKQNETRLSFIFFGKQVVELVKG